MTLQLSDDENERVSRSEEFFVQIGIVRLLVKSLASLGSSDCPLSTIENLFPHRSTYFQIFQIFYFRPPRSFLVEERSSEKRPSRGTPSTIES